MKNIVICSYDQDFIPEKKTDWSACFDFKSAKETIINPWQVCLIPSWVRTYMPNWWVLKLYPRSSLPKKWLLFPHSVGIVDADYRWEIFIQVYNFKNEQVVIEKNERIAQWEFVQCFVKSWEFGTDYIPELNIVVEKDHFDNFATIYESWRGEWWYWSTGNKG